MLKRLFSQLTRRRADSFAAGADQLAEQRRLLGASLAQDTFPPYALAEITGHPLREQAAALIASGGELPVIESLLDQLPAHPAAAIDRLLRADAWLRAGLAVRAEPLLEELAGRSDNHGARACALLAQRLFDRGEFARAGDLAIRAARLAPESPSCHILLGSLADCADREDEALLHYRRAWDLRPESLLTIGHLATALIGAGRLREGLGIWVQADLLVAAYGQAGRHAVWDGRPLGDASLLVITSYGYGDTIQFLRFVAHLREREPRARLSILIAPALARLATESGWFEAVYCAPVDRSGFDWQITQTGLPLALGIEARDLLRHEPYLRVTGKAKGTIAAWLPPPNPGRLKVGLRWFGRPLEFDAKRSIPFALLQPLFEVPGVDWVALVEDSSLLGALPSHPMFDASAQMGDFGDTGALMSQLDLTISVDTSVAHVGGALGLPVWLMARPDHEWRWGRTGPDNPWYSSVRVYRHEDGFDWKAMVSRVAAALRELAPASH